MNVSASAARNDFFAMREVAAARMQPQKTASVNKPLTTPIRPVDPLLAAQSTRGPTKGRLVDFIA